VSVTPRIPGGPAKLLAAIREPLRLEILLSLEQRPGSAADLEDELGADYAKVSYAFRELLRAGLIERRPDAAQREPAPTGRGRDLVKIYGTRHTGWPNVLQSLADVAATAE
jgi:DNA-binding transcriptional ArsR family regulator